MDFVPTASVFFEAGFLACEIDIGQEDEASPFNGCLDAIVETGHDINTSALAKAGRGSVAAGWVAPEANGPGAPRGFIEVPASHCRVDPERRASGGAGASGSHLAAPGEKEGTHDE
jgi:hypothetical protein